jgi:hypothetical protein
MLNQVISKLDMSWAMLNFGVYAQLSHICWIVLRNKLSRDFVCVVKYTAEIVWGVK